MRHGRGDVMPELLRMSCKDREVCGVRGREMESAVDEL